MIPAWGLSLLIAGGGTGLQLLFAPRPPKQQPVDVGKFDDVRIQGSDYGAFITRGWGKFRVAGNIVFSNGIQHYVIDEPTGGGKGVPQAPATRRHVYQSSFDVLVARGPVVNFLRVWEDADIWVGAVNPNEASASFEAEAGTLSGGATTGTTSGVTFVRNLNSTGELLMDLTTLAAPANPYDPDENATEKTRVEMYYLSPVDATASITVDDGTGPSSATTTFATSGGDWTARTVNYNGFLESLEVASATDAALSFDYFYVTKFWQLPEVNIAVPYQAATVSGAVNPDIIYPPDINDPSAYYNADVEDLKDAQGTYSIETTIPGDVTRWYTGTETQTADPIIQEWLDGRYGTGQGVLRASAMRGLVHVMLGNKTLRQARPANYTFELDAGPDDVNDILEDLCDDVGIGSGDRDFTATAGLTQVGFLESSNSSRASYFDQLQRYHLFRRAEIDGKVKTVLHSFTSVYTVPVNSLRAHDDGEQMPGFDAEVINIEEHLLPREMRFSVMNPQRDYHNETATAQLFTVPGTESEEFGFNIVDELDTCRLQVEKALLKKHSESQAVEISAMPELAKYSVGDVITVPINGRNVNIRIEKKQMTLPIGKIRIQGVTVNPFTPTEYQSDTTLTTNLTREQISAFNYPRNSVVVPIVSRPIREADKGKLGAYLAMSGRGRGAGENIALHREFGEENYIIQYVADTPSQVGLCEDTLGTHADITTKDTTNVLDIWFFDSIELESVPTADIERYPNLNLMRVGDEWVQFETATAQTLEDNSPYRVKWRISNLWRGRFGTESAKGSHAADEYAVHATHALRFYELEEEDIGKTVTLKAVTGGQAVEVATATNFLFEPLPDSYSVNTLFDQYTNATTAGTTRETLYANEIPAGTFLNDGDKVFFRLAGKYAANANTGKYLFLEVGGTDVSESDEQSSNGGKWEIDGFLIRTAEDVVRYEAEFTTSSVTPVLREGEITGLDLLDSALSFNLDARTNAAAGDITATLGTAWFMPAAPDVEALPEGVLLFGGASLTFLGEDLTFNP
jgi:hypothetical protein